MYKHIYIYIHVHTYLYMYIYIYIYIYILIYIYTHIHICICLCVYIYKYEFTRIYVYMNAVEEGIKTGTLRVLTDTRIDVATMALKHSLVLQSTVVVAQVVCLSVCCGGYLIRVAEAPGNAAHAHELSNNLWLACLALTTSHYGDVAPLTHYGRSHT